MTAMQGQPEAGGCPFRPEVHADVIDYFVELQDAAPVYRQADGSFVLTRFDDVMAALADAESYSSVQPLEDTGIDEANARSVVYSHGEDHLRLRQLVNRAFAPRGVGEMADRARANADEVLAAIEPGEEFDVVELGTRFARRNFADLIGMAPDQRPRLDAWITSGWMFARPQVVRDATTSGGPGTGTAAGDPGGTQVEAFYAGFRDLRSYLGEVTAPHLGHEPRTCQTTEGVSPLVRALTAAVRKDPDALDEIATRLMPPILAGGTSTVAHMFPNVVTVLLDHPEVVEELRRSPEQLDVSRPSEVIEEVLRLKSVVQGMARVTAREVEVRGVRIPQGSVVHLYFLGADHDRLEFEQPDSFRDRGISRHLGFSFGTHACLGQSFVRLQLKVFIAALLERFGSLERVELDSVSWGQVGTYYTPDRMRVIGRA